MKTKSQVASEFRQNLKSILDKYGIEIEVVFEHSGYGGGYCEISFSWDGNSEQEAGMLTYEGRFPTPEKLTLR